MKTKLPTSIVYNWYKVGRFTLYNEVYNQENLSEGIIVYSLGNLDDFDLADLEKNKSVYSPDIVISLEDSNISESALADKILYESQSANCFDEAPFFSVFTPIFHTGEKILRAYNSLKNQIFQGWEWVVIDDSNDDETWNILENISLIDPRIKLNKIKPLSGGNIGLVKNRAASLCSGKWLVELDHDDELLNDCLSECYNASLKFPDSEFMYSDFCSMYEDGSMVHYDHETDGNWYARPDNLYVFGYSGNVWETHHGKQYLRHYHCDMNPLTIRFNIGMPNHVRVWKKDFYHKIGGHNKRIPVADDFELIIRTFLKTKFTHIKKMLYIQWHSGNSTVDNNSKDINRRARIIRDLYDFKIHERILELGFEDWNWSSEAQTSIRKVLNTYSEKKYFEHENVLNYIYE